MNNNFTRYPASAAMLVISALFWGITQRLMVIVYRRFWTTYRSQIEEVQKKKDFLILEDRTDTLSRNVGKGLPLNAA
jgi:hypothetical protein